MNDLLQQKMCTAAETKASVGEVVLLEGLLRRSVPNARNQMLLRELGRLGFDAATGTYRLGTPFEQVMRAADRCLAPVAKGLQSVLDDAYYGTEKGDARFYLRGLGPQGEASLVHDV